MPQFKASVLLATYNRLKLLRRTLLGLARQSFQDFEIIICDDGSDRQIVEIVDTFKKKLKGRLIHISHEHHGFRKCRIYNEGILQARSDYLIFLDSDCIPHRHFVYMHISNSKPGRFLAGRRLMLGEKLTEELSEEDIMSGKLERLDFLLFNYRQLRHVSAGFFMPWLNKIVQTSLELKGCNFSCFRSDMWKINGFDERFVMPGVGEDTDIDHRFRLAGLKPYSVKYSALCYHQYHPFISSPCYDAHPASSASSIASYGLREHMRESSQDFACSIYMV